MKRKEWIEAMTRPAQCWKFNKYENIALFPQCDSNDETRDWHGTYE